MKVFSTAAMAALLFVPAAARAQDPQPPRERSEEVGDANRVICRTMGSTGSRVNSTRVCLTAAEWAEQKREARQKVEQDQSRRGTSGQ